MKVKAYILVLGLLALSHVLWAQDVQRMAERQIIGTARYVGMGGAMTAIGGDPSAVMDNPAGLGLYRRSEISLTLDEMVDHTQQFASRDRYRRSQFSAPQVSIVWAWGDPDKQRGLIFSNFLFNYNRLATYNRDMFVRGDDLGLAETICRKTMGLPEQNLQDLPWNDVEIGWLSILGYESYLINPMVDSMATDPLQKYGWSPAVNLSAGSLSISESGSYDQYTIAWSGNVNNQWYIGLSLNVPTLTYTKNVSLLETARNNNAELKSMLHMSGVGVSGSIGLIYRPISSLRVGASFQTPTVMSLSMQTEGDLYSTIDGNDYEVLTPASGNVSMELVSPLRTSVSVAGQIGNIGLIALQYDYAHSNQMEDVHTLRAGVEAQAYKGLYLNAGYVYESSFLQEDPLVEIPYNDMRTDIDYRYTANSQYFSFGMGYRSNFVIAQLAYQYRWQTINQYASEMQAVAMNLHAQTHRIVATLAWRF